MEGTSFRNKMKQPHPQFAVKPCDLFPMQLPTREQVVGRIMRLRLEEMERRDVAVDMVSVKSCVSQVADEIIEIWDRASIPVKRVDYVREMIMKLWKKKDGLRKSRAQCSNLSMSSLFDISKSSAPPEHPDDRAFLADQRTDRRLHIGGVDQVTTERWRRRVAFAGVSGLYFVFRMLFDSGRWSLNHSIPRLCRIPKRRSKF